MGWLRRRLSGHAREGLRALRSRLAIPRAPRKPTAFPRGVEARINSRAELMRLRDAVAAPRSEFERFLSKGRQPDERWTLGAWCEVCERAAAMHVDGQYSDGSVPNYRERLQCEHCGLNNRQRFAFAFVRDLLGERFGARGRVYVYEQVTPFFRIAAERWVAASVVGSEYLGQGYRSGESIHGIVHQDATALSFGTAALDVIVSNDVYEHVPDDGAAFGEAARVLAPGGCLIFSVPFWAGNDLTRRRARLERGAVVHLEPPVYHGNPVDPTGSLVFFDYGWDLLDRLKAAGFRDAYALGYYSVACGYLGEGLQLIFMAER